MIAMPYDNLKLYDHEIRMLTQALDALLYDNRFGPKYTQLYRKLHKELQEREIYDRGYAAGWHAASRGIEVDQIENPIFQQGFDTGVARYNKDVNND